MYAVRKNGRGFLSSCWPGRPWATCLGRILEIPAGDATLVFGQVKHTHDIVNKNGDVTTTVVLGEVSILGVHAVVSRCQPYTRMLWYTFTKSKDVLQTNSLTLGERGCVSCQLSAINPTVFDEAYSSTAHVSVIQHVVLLLFTTYSIRT